MAGAGAKLVAGIDQDETSQKATRIGGRGGDRIVVARVGVVG